MPYSPRAILSRYLKKIGSRRPIFAAAQHEFLQLRTVASSYAKSKDILLDGDVSDVSFIVASGMVSRSKTSREGKRQILALHVPGDMIYLQSAMPFPLDHDIRAHPNTRLLAVYGSDLAALAATHQDFGQALWLDAAIEIAILREWAVSLGRRDATQRLSHLILELAERYRAVELLTNEGFPMPLNQQDLSEALGMTIIHLNRVAQALRRQGLIEWRGHRVKIINWKSLRAGADFDSGYLRLPRPETDNGEARRDSSPSIPFAPATGLPA